MSTYTHGFYRPYINSSLGFTLHVGSFEDHFYGFIIEDMKLLYQPVQEPNIGILFFVIRTIIMVFSEFINYKVINKMKKNTGLLNDIVTVQSYTIIISFPSYLLFVTLTDFIHPLNEIIGQWFCSCGWFFLKVCFGIVTTNSLIATLLRYLFIVHQNV